MHTQQHVSPCWTRLISPTSHTQPAARVALLDTFDVTDVSHPAARVTLLDTFDLTDAARRAAL